MSKFGWLILVIGTVYISSCKKSISESGEKLSDAYSGWRTYAGTKDGMRYSSNDQINTENVHELEIAWRYSSLDKDTLNRSQNQCNPIVIDGTLYGISPQLKLFALDAGTGQEKWIFDPAMEDNPAVKSLASYLKVSRARQVDRSTDN